MLKEMREGAKSTVLKLLLFGLLLMAMAGLALMDVQGMFRGGVSSNSIVKIGREKITAAEFDRMVQMALRAQNMKQSDAYNSGLPRQVLKQEVDNRLFSKAASDIGLRVGDALAAKQIKEIIAPALEKGMTEKDALQRMLQSYSLSEGQLVAMIKDQTASQHLLNTITSGGHAPQQLVNDAMKYRHEWRRGEYFTLTSSDIDTSKGPAEEDLKTYYNSIAREYALPEYRTLAVILLDKTMLGDVVKISDDKLKAYYDDNIADYKTQQTRTISQIVAADEEAARKIHAAAEKTKDMQKAADAAGKGKGTYIKASDFTEGAMMAEISKTAFAGEAGKVLPPVKSPLGWHVLYIEKVVPEVVKTFDSVKAEIEKELLQDKISEALYQQANKIDDEIAGGKTLPEVAKENNIPAIRLGKIDVRGLGQNGKKPEVTLPLFDKVVESGFSLKPGDASPLIETPEGAFMIVAAEEIFPSAQQPFDKVRADVLIRWKTNNQAMALADKAAKIMERLKKGESFARIAGEFKKPVETTELVLRGTDPAKSKMAQNMMQALFSLDSQGDVATVSGDNSITILHLAERKIQSPKEISKEDRDALTALINRSLQQDLLEQYRMSLMAKYDVNINEKLLGEMYRPKDVNGDLGGEE